VLANADTSAARSYADRVARHLAEAGREHAQPLSTSAGISVYRRSQTPAELVEAADGALYAAKAAGRARSAWFDGETIRTGTSATD
jgi:PleD family two-component response regulator